MVKSAAYCVLENEGLISLFSVDLEISCGSMYNVVLVGLYMYTAIDLKMTVLAIKLCHYP